MSFKTDLQSNNTDLQAILDTINALPEAGSGGSEETYTGDISYDDMTMNGQVDAYYTNSNFEVENAKVEVGNAQTITVLKGSLIYVTAPSTTTHACENATLLCNTADGKLFSVDADEFIISCRMLL